MEKIEFSNAEYIDKKNRKNNNPIKLIILIRFWNYVLL